MTKQEFDKKLQATVDQYFLQNKKLIKDSRDRIMLSIVTVAAFLAIAWLDFPFISFLILVLGLTIATGLINTPVMMRTLIGKRNLIKYSNKIKSDENYKDALKKQRAFTRVKYYACLTGVFPTYSEAVAMVEGAPSWEEAYKNIENKEQELKSTRVKLFGYNMILTFVAFLLFSQALAYLVWATDFNTTILFVLCFAVFAAFTMFVFLVPNKKKRKKYAALKYLINNK